MKHFINHTEENYLKAILHLSYKTDKGVTTNSIADLIQTKPSSVTDMMKKLADKDLITHKKYYGVNLTESGRLIALKTIRKHRLWEVFLVDKLNFNWDEVHDIAEQLEHIQSPELTTRLDNFLGNPQYDPHGDPIPDANGNINDNRKTISLADADFNIEHVVVGVSDSSSQFLKYLESSALTLGALVTPLLKHDFDSSMQLKIGGTDKNISERVANNIKVRVK